MTSQTIIRASDFTHSIGVEAQLNYTDGAYHVIANVLNDLKYLGINLIRAAAPNSAGNLGGQNDYKIAAAAGIRFDFVANGNLSLPSTVSQISAFDAAYPNSVYAIEGPNEVDINPITYNGLSGGAAAISYQNALYGLVTANPLLKKLPVYSFSYNSKVSATGGYTQVALHPYPASGSEPGAYLTAAYAQLSAAMGVAPTNTVITETGYSTAVGNASGVDQLTQAKLTLNMIFDAFKSGVQAVYLYGLLDAYVDPTGTSLANHYGLFDINNKPKILANAIHNMMALLNDTGATAATFTPQALTYSQSNANVSSYVIEKSTSTYEIAVWAEPKIWNATTQVEIAAPAQTEVIKFGQVMGDIQVFDPLSGMTPIAEVKNSSSIAISVTDHPLFVQVSGVPNATASQSDVLTGAPNAVLYAGAGVDTFDFHTKFGIETINNFVASGASHDVVQFDKSVFADWAHLLGATKQSGSDLMVTLDPTDVLTLKNVTLASFTQADAKFL